MVAETTTTVLEEYLAADFRYKYHNGPNIITDEESARINGLNCITFVHLALRRLFDRNLPGQLRAYEMFHDQQLFEEVDAVAQGAVGDVFFFTPPSGRAKLLEFEPQYDEAGNIQNLPAMPRVHLALHAGGESAEEPMLMHANFRDNGIGMWPLSEFIRQPRYAEVAAIKRLRDVEKPLDTSGMFGDIAV